VLFADTV